eukprot:GHVU01027542.1.p1 GENE.GHVU01027542.1~~GHVU01027542.1.p1  ORF type:complete len:150 (-),score=18.50 GHVU01027542.1:577-1026(-)
MQGIITTIFSIAIDRVRSSDTYPLGVYIYPQRAAEVYAPIWSPEPLRPSSRPSLSVHRNMVSMSPGLPDSGDIIVTPQQEEEEVEEEEVEAEVDGGEENDGEDGLSPLEIERVPVNRLSHLQLRHAVVYGISSRKHNGNRSAWVLRALW